MFHFVFLEKSMYEVYLIRIKKKSARIRATICTHRYADCMLKNTFTKHNKYVVIKKLENFYISFRDQNVVRRFIWKGWHFIFIWKTLACPIISLREEVLSNKHGLILPLFTEVSVPSKTKTMKTGALSSLVYMCWCYRCCFFLRMNLELMWYFVFLNLFMHTILIHMHVPLWYLLTRQDE